MDRAVPRLLTVLAAGCSVLLVRAQFTDDFSDGDLTADPAWEGNTAVFVVNAEQQLQLNDAVAATSQLRSAYAIAALDDSEWRVRVKLSFAPSSSNFARVYLVSDQADLTGPLNGYYLQFGEAGSLDAIELFEQTGAASTSVCRGTDAQIAATFDVGVQVKRDAAGNWQLLVDPAGGTDYVLQASGAGTAHTTSAFIGVRCTYTVSNATRFYFDDLYAGPAIIDTEAPTLVSAAPASPVNVDVRFSEPVQEAGASTATNYTLEPSIAVTTAVWDGADPAAVHLLLGTAMTNGTTYTVTATGVQDLAGNSGPATSVSFTYLVPDVPQPGDVIINEIMADPTPVVGLPEVEFVEVHNATADKTFDLAGWTLDDGGTPAALPAYTLGPQAYVVLTTTAGAPLFATIPSVVGVPGFPSLNNSGDTLRLRAPGNALIDQVPYASSWYGDPGKAGGGWTLERIDPTTPCSNATNWTASVDPAGGTPGAQNSVYSIVPDTDPPALVGVSVNGPTEIALAFSEPMDQASLIAGTYAIDPPVAVIGVTSPDPEHAVLTLGVALAAGQLATVTVTNVTDCPGNPIGGMNTLPFALPESVAPGDVVINEVLYDPIGQGSDLVELYNRSQKVLSLAGWQLANVDHGAIANATPITATAILLMPGEYLAITEDVANITATYPLSHADRLLEGDLPGYNNGTGTVVLLGPDNDTLDRFTYDDDLHFELLSTTEGVSLERIDPARPSDDPSNWHSAAADVGFATPGYRNSQYTPAAEASGELRIEPAIFSPDNDGHQDVLTIAYRFNEAGFVGTMKVFDIAGREVRTLMDNTLLSTTGAISWDGLMGTGELARMGPYVVYFEAYDLAGNVEKFRETVVLAHRLD